MRGIVVCWAAVAALGLLAAGGFAEGGAVVAGALTAELSGAVTFLYEITKGENQ